MNLREINDIPLTSISSLILNFSSSMGMRQTEYEHTGYALKYRVFKTQGDQS